MASSKRQLMLGPRDQQKHFQTLGWETIILGLNQNLNHQFIKMKNEMEANIDNIQ